MRTLSLRIVAVAALAALTLTSAGCVGQDAATTALPEAVPSTLPEAVPTTIPPSPSPTRVLSRRPEPEYVPEPKVPRSEPEILSQFEAGTPTPSAGRPSAAGTTASSSTADSATDPASNPGATPTTTAPARRNPPPSGSVDCARSKCIALTFDDGPGPHTARLVGMLRSKGARATFFMTGTMVRANPGIARQVANTVGMEIGNHTATHAQLTQVGSTQLRREINGNRTTIEQATGRNITVFRPPYGSHNSTVDAMAATAGESVILWDVDTNDWQTRSAIATRRAVAQQARPGSIVLMHDIHGSTVDAVPGIIDDLQGQGYVLVTVSELLGGTDPGRVYSRR